MQIEGKINTTGYLIVGARFNRLGQELGKTSLRITKTKPALDTNEIAVELSLSLPKSLFIKPQLQATIDAPESDNAIEISSEIQQNITDAIAEASGLFVTLEVNAPGDNHE